MSETHNSKETKKNPKTGVEQFDKRLKKLEKKLSNVKAKIASLEEEKKKINSEISHCKDEQILFMVKSSNLTVEEITESIRLARSIQQSGFSSEELEGLSKSDIEELTSLSLTTDFTIESTNTSTTEE